MDITIQAWLDQEDAHIRAMVRRYGWFIQYVGGSELCTLPGCCCSADQDQDTVPFAYTQVVRPTAPGLFIFGVPQQTAGGVLNDLASRYGLASICCRKPITFENWPHRHPRGRAKSRQSYSRPTGSTSAQPSSPCRTAAQLDDEAGRFPWEPDYAARRYSRDPAPSELDQTPSGDTESSAPSSGRVS